MTDELDRFRAAMRAAGARPDPAVKAAHLRAARENFAAAKESAGALRPTAGDPPKVGWVRRGVETVIRTLSPLRATLGATTALVAVGLFLVLPETGALLRKPAPAALRAPEELDAPRPAPEARTEATTKTAETDALATRTEDRDADAPEPAPAPEAGHPAARSQELRRDQSLSAKTEAGTAGSVDGRAALADGSAAAGLALPQAPSGGTRQRSQLGEGAQSFAAVPPATEFAPAPEPNTEAFSNARSNPVKVTAEEPVSTFSIDVDTASYAVVRSSLMAGALPPAEAVRVEEMVNYFPYAWPAPSAGEAFRPTVTVLPTPWNAGTRLVTVALQGALPEVAARPPLNLVFLIDTSGSMQDPNKLPLLKQSFRMMLNELRPEDQVAIVTYAGSAGEVLAPTRASDKAAILAALDRLEAGGSTAGEAGLTQAYAVAEGMKHDGDVTRVILATDGDFNVGLSDPDALKRFIEGKRSEGTYLSVLGFGRGNLDDATMQALAQNGNGTAAYIDTLNEARKVLVDELSGALFPIADDVKIQVEWNPATVAEYRLIGYETRALRREDFNNDKVDAGEIGAGTAVTAIYEVTPVGSPAVRSDPLRYQTATAARGDAGELGFLRLRYKAPGEAASRLIETPIPVAETVADGPVPAEARFAAAIAGFGQLLRGSHYLGDWSYADAISLANGARGDDPFGYRAEAVQLMRLAEGLSGR